MSVSRAIVFKCQRSFKDGRQNLENDERQGSDAVIHTPSATTIKTALEGDLTIIFEQTLAVAQFIAFWPMY